MEALVARCGLEDPAAERDIGEFRELFSDVDSRVLRDPLGVRLPLRLSDAIVLLVQPATLNLNVLQLLLSSLS